jgi:hypothetical protein
LAGSNSVSCWQRELRASFLGSHDAGLPEVAPNCLGCRPRARAGVLASWSIRVTSLSLNRVGPSGADAGAHQDGQPCARPQWPQSSRRETASVMVPVSSTLLFEGRAQCARAGWGGWLPVGSCDVVCDGLAAGSGHCGRLDPFGTRIGSPQRGGVRLNETGGASIWMSPKGVCRHGATTFLHYFSITTVLGNRRSIPSPIRVVAASFTFGLCADGPRVSALCDWRETALVRG